MSRPLISLILLFIVLGSCQNNEDRIKGDWIEQDNFDNPTTMEIQDFSFKMKTNNHKSEKLYYFRNDTFYVNGMDQIYKYIIKIENDELEFYDIDSVIPTTIFERNTYKNMVSYFNYKKRTSIELPHLEINFLGRGYNSQNSLFADLINGELVMYFNGELHVINDTSYLALCDNKWESTCQLFIDKNITISALNKIKTELRKAQLNSITYSFMDKEDEVKNIRTILPPIDSVGGRPLPPMASKLNRLNQRDVLIQVATKALIVSGDSVKRERLKETVKKIIISDNKTILRVVFNNQLNYEAYINHLSEIQNAYIELRNEYSMNVFNTSDYLDLEYEEMQTVRDLFPMNIYEINEAEIEKYAL